MLALVQTALKSRGDPSEASPGPLQGFSGPLLRPSSPRAVSLAPGSEPQAEPAGAHFVQDSFRNLRVQGTARKAAPGSPVPIL